MRTRRSASSSSDPVSSSAGAREVSESHFPLKGEKSRHQSEIVHRASGHTPVLLHEVLHWLEIKPDDVVLDATLGGAGHARAMIKMLGASGVFIGMDADSDAVKRAEKSLSSEAKLHTRGPKLFLQQGNFRNLSVTLAALHITKISKALFDLGWSSYQLSAGRGFSFLRDEPLLMTYAKEISPETLTAENIVNTWKESSIADVLFGWGEERHARKIARAIVEARKKKPIRTSLQLADIISTAVRSSGKIHPATRTFQALRIAVNDEFGALRQGLRAAFTALSRSGRLAVIAFHSGEDREVKNLMREWIQKGEAKALFKSPIMVNKDERRGNPRSRSAKLRVIEKSKE